MCELVCDGCIMYGLFTELVVIFERVSIHIILMIFAIIIDTLFDVNSE